MSGNEGSGHGEVSPAREALNAVREGAHETHETVERVERIRHAQSAIDAVQPGAAVAATLTDVSGRIAGSEAARAVASGLGAAGEVFGAVRGLVGLARDAAEALAEHLPEADFAVELHGATRWTVRSFEVTEALSTVGDTVVTVVSDAEGADPYHALGRDGALVISRRGVARRVAGVVSRVEHEGFEDGKVRARLTIVPALWALSQRRDSRIFEAMTVRDIVEDVLRRGLAPYRRAWRWSLQRALAPREHTVQYRRRTSPSSSDCSRRRAFRTR
jgi:type VI secretion system secreted protein VgrG